MAASIARSNGAKKHSIGAFVTCAGGRGSPQWLMPTAEMPEEVDRQMDLAIAVYHAESNLHRVRSK
jgi:hypothetical protein